MPDDGFIRSMKLQVAIKIELVRLQKLIFIQSLVLPLSTFIADEVFSYFTGSHINVS